MTERATLPLLDTRVGIATPEGVLVQLNPAGPVPRALAFAVDFLLRGGVYVLGSFLLPFALQKSGVGLLLLLVFLLEWFYPLLFETLNGGVTPGKAVVGLAVVEQDGRPVGWSASTIRNFLRVADMLPFAYLAGIASMLLTSRFQRLGDLAAGTLVVHRGNTAINRARAMPAVAPLAPTVALSTAEQHALVALAARHDRLSQARLDELAAIAPSLTGSDPAHQRERLLGIARYLSGDRAADGTAAPARRPGGRP